MTSATNIETFEFYPQLLQALQAHLHDHQEMEERLVQQTADSVQPFATGSSALARTLWDLGVRDSAMMAAGVRRVLLLSDN